MTSFVDKPRFSNTQNAARVFILSYKHIGMVSLSYFENQILTLESLAYRRNPQKENGVKIMASVCPTHARNVFNPFSHKNVLNA